jgi:hypothetical protein
MRSLPLDQARTGQFQIIATSAKLDQSQTQKQNVDGVPQWTVQVLNTPVQGDSGFTAKAGLEEVTVAAAKPPEFPPLTVVKFGDLVARPWSMNDRSGVALSASSVAAVAGGGSRE